MKNFLLVPLMLLICKIQSADAQSCTPDLSITQPGIYPDAATNFPQAYAGVAYSTVIQFKVITDTVSNGTHVNVTDITMDSVTGLPPGFTYVSNPANHIFPGGSNACFTLNGNPAMSDTGIYHIAVHVTLHGVVFGFIHVSQSSAITDYKIVINGPPEARFNADVTSICAGNAVNFSDFSTDNPTVYQWSFPGGNPSSSSLKIPPPIIYPTPGNYNVSLTVYNPVGNHTKTKNGYIDVSNGVMAIVTPSGNVSACPGSSLTLSANTGTGLSYQWLKNGIVISGATALTYDATSAGSFSVQISSSSGCSLTSPSTTVNISNVFATISPQGPTSFCDGGNVTLNANTGNNLNYQWKKNGVNISGETNSFYSASSSGNYKVFITDQAGCTALSSATTVTVNSLPSAVITAGGPTTFCKGDNVTLSANAGSGLTYQWTSVYVPVNGATNSSFVAHAKGWFRVNVTNTNGCSATSNLIHVYVDTLPSATVTASGPLTFCQGEKVTLTANSGNGLSYQWTKHDIDIPGATNISFTPSMWGSYRVVTTNSFGCSKTSNRKFVTINPLPLASITASGPLTFCQGQSVNLTANTGIGLSYQWTKYHVDISGGTGLSYLAKKTGAYRVVVTDLNGCTKTSVPVNVLVNCREEGNENNGIAFDENKVVLYPNPANSVATIDLNLSVAGNVAIHVFDLTGKLISVIAEGNFNEGKHQFTFDASGFEKGIYFVNFRTNDEIKTIKLVIN